MMYQAWIRPGIWGGGGLRRQHWEGERERGCAGCAWGRGLEMEAMTHISEHEEEDVDEGVGGADASLDPNCAQSSD